MQAACSGGRHAAATAARECAASAGRLVQQPRLPIILPFAGGCGRTCATRGVLCPVLLAPLAALVRWRGPLHHPADGHLGGRLHMHGQRVPPRHVLQGRCCCCCACRQASMYACTWWAASCMPHATCRTCKSRGWGGAGGGSLGGRTGRHAPMHVLAGQRAPACICARSTWVHSAARALCTGARVRPGSLKAVAAPQLLAPRCCCGSCACGACSSRTSPCASCACHMSGPPVKKCPRRHHHPPQTPQTPPSHHRHPHHCHAGQQGLVRALRARQDVWRGGLPAQAGVTAVLVGARQREEPQSERQALPDEAVPEHDVPHRAVRALAARMCACVHACAG